VLRGRIGLSTVTVDTRYGSLTIPVEELRRIDFSWRASPEDRDRIEPLLSDLAVPERRAAARRILLDIGPAVLPQLTGVQDTPDEAARAVLESLGKQLRTRQGRRSVEDDVVFAKRFTVLGTVRFEGIDVESAYGELRVPRYDIDRLFFAGATPFLEVDRVLIVKTWTDVDQEFAHTRDAIARYTKLKLVEFTGTTSRELKKALRRYQVVVLPEFESGGSQAQTAAREASATLKKFVRDGGVIVSCGGQHNAGFLAASGLLNCQGASNDSAGTIRKRHAIVRGIRGGVPAVNATIPLAGGGGKMKPIVSSQNGSVIVGLATYGQGAIVYCGWDFFESTEVHQRILANAVQWAATREFAGLPLATE
jgi:hypothetical protein